MSDELTTIQRIEKLSELTPEDRSKESHQIKEDVLTECIVCKTQDELMVVLDKHFGERKSTQYAKGYDNTYNVALERFKIPLR